MLPVVRDGSAEGLEDLCAAARVDWAPGACAAALAAEADAAAAALGSCAAAHAASAPSPGGGDARARRGRRQRGARGRARGRARARARARAYRWGRATAPSGLTKLRPSLRRWLRDAAARSDAPAAAEGAIAARVELEEWWAPAACAPCDGARARVGRPPRARARARARRRERLAALEAYPQTRGADRFLATASRILDAGFVLTVDYGYARARARERRTPPRRRERPQRTRASSGRRRRFEYVHS